MSGGPARFAKFVALGGVAAAVNWGSRFALSEVLPYLAAVVVAYAIGMVVAFALFSRFVFPASGQSFASQAGRFALVNVAGIGQVVLVAWGLQRHLFPALGWTGAAADAVAHGIAIGVPAVSSYFGHRSFSFR